MLRKVGKSDSFMEPSPPRRVLVSVVSAIVGALFGALIEIIRDERFERDTKLVADEFERRGMNPPLVVHTLKPGTFSFLVSIIFMACALVANAAYRVLKHRHSSSR